MATFQDILGQVAQVVGGTQPDAANNPYWYSGDQTGTGGIAGLKGCYASPPNTIVTLPVGIVIAHEFSTQYAISHKQDEDMVHLWVLVRKNDSRTQVANLNPYRDSVPAAFEQHMQLNASARVWQAVVESGHTGIFAWGKQDYLGWEFQLKIYRETPIVFSA